eukprot:2138818-Pleurochrysis_carterae.AAC.1
MRFSSTVCGLVLAECGGRARAGGVETSAANGGVECCSSPPASDFHTLVLPRRTYVCVRVRVLVHACSA